MIRMGLSWTFSEIEKLIEYKEDIEFANTVKKIETIYSELEDSGILTNLDEIIWLFKQFSVEETEADCYSCSCGHTIYIVNKEEFISKIVSNSFKKSDNIYESWLMMLRNLNESIDELFRYGFSDEDEYVIFLKNILMFLSFVKVFDNKTDYFKNINN